MEHEVEVNIVGIKEVSAHLIRVEIAGSAPQPVLILHHEVSGAAATLRVVNGGEAFADLPDDQGRAVLAKFAELMHGEEQE